MPSKHSVLREGVLAGLSGAAAIAIWFLLLDTMRGAPLATPALLGSHLLQAVGVGSTSVRIATQVLSYTVVHFGLFILVGIVAAVVMAAALWRTHRTLPHRLKNALANDVDDITGRPS